MNIKFRENDSSEYIGGKKKKTKAINTPSWSLHLFISFKLKQKKHKLTSKHMIKKTKVKAMRKFKTNKQNHRDVLTAFYSLCRFRTSSALTIVIKQ